MATVEKRESLIVPILTFAPEPYDLLRELKVVVQSSDDECLASFFDANVNASGSNETDAVSNLKDMILDRFTLLEAMPPESLGAPMRKQLEVLRVFMRRSGKATRALLNEP